MKFPSLKNLLQSAVNTIKRYPFETLFALAGTIAATIEIELNHLNRISENWCMRTIMIANLGFLLSLSATLYTQSKGWKTTKIVLAKIAAAVIAVLFIFIINPPERQADYTRFFLLSLAFHLMVSFAAFTGKGQIQGFWQFNKTLFLRFLACMLYGVVLFAGLAAAIGATNFLFNFKFEWDTYQILWVWITGMFTTTFFLAGVPTNTRALNEDESYPKGLKIFTQYVLIPLSTVYVIILLAYEVKILIEWKLPKGLVSNLILGYAVFGILSLLLVYPIREQNENKWLKTYTRSFYFLLIPLQILLFVAVGTRVFSYGVTEFRYFLIALALWLLFISLYFLLFKKQNIKIIPISLCILTLLSIYGPQSAFTMSMYSQRGMVISFFKKHNGFKDGKLTLVDSTKINMKEGSLGASRLSYFIYHYDLKGLQPYFKRDLNIVADSLAKQKGEYNNLLVDREGLRTLKYQWAKKQLGLGRFSDYYYPFAETTTDFSESESYVFSQKENITVVKGYDIELSSNLGADTVINNYNGITIKQVYFAETHRCSLMLNNDIVKFDPIEIVNKMMTDTTTLEKYRSKKNKDNLYMPKGYELPANLMQVTRQTPGYTVVFQFSSIYFDRSKKGNPDIKNFSGTYLIKIK
ncbi:hypothetical protein FHW88_002567 [Mucilaginibacter sp. SG538B]|uniref:DUF4153 domain-containing protein n=1 Tax=Mucilaginibacter sp. SG538B TaxID=2587021 RepID=UPI00159DEF87|nr:DUF4153 domain-containing protein [Mucilaginibacter sp. SG538B]NVM64278.1 hypothetical protein [Mucilaginibacter sp. SG538B]